MKVNCISLLSSKFLRKNNFEQRVPCKSQGLWIGNGHFPFFQHVRTCRVYLYYLFLKNLLEDEHQERGWYRIQETMWLKRNLMKTNFKVTVEQLFWKKSVQIRMWNHRTPRRHSPISRRRKRRKNQINRINKILRIQWIRHVIFHSLAT